MLDNAGFSTDWSGHARDQLPPLWVDLVDQVDDDVGSVREMMKRLESLHGERVNSVFDKDVKSRDREIEGLTSSITAKGRERERERYNIYMYNIYIFCANTNAIRVVAPCRSFATPRALSRRLAGLLSPVRA